MADDSIQQSDNDPRIANAIKFLQFANEADQMNRSEALEDLKFAAGDQWPVEIQNSRVLEQAQITFNAAAKIIVRHDPAITTDCRIKYEGIEYVIHSVVDIVYSGRYMELLAYTTN
jgi:SPP1 family predicted phage head-tail adaptor